jgi:hypothetical protein
MSSEKQKAARAKFLAMIKAKQDKKGASKPSSAKPSAKPKGKKK